MRYMLLPTIGDPFILRYWLRFYDRQIASRIDKLYVGQAGPTNPEYISLSKALCDERGISFNTRPDLFWSFDGSMQAAYDLVQPPGREEDIIELMQTDIFVFDGTILDEYHKSLDLGHYRLIGAPKFYGGFVQYWPEEPSRRDARKVEQLWPGWLFSRSSDFHKAYMFVLEDMKADIATSSGRTPFCAYRGNEEWVFMAHLLQSSVPEDQLLRLHQGFTQPHILQSAPSSRWLHFGRIEQFLLPHGIMRDQYNIPLICDPAGPWGQNLLPLSEHHGARELPSFEVGMQKAIVISSNDCPALLHLRDKHLYAVDKAIRDLGFNQQEVDSYCQMFLSWIN